MWRRGISIVSQTDYQGTLLTITSCRRSQTVPRWRFDCRLKTAPSAVFYNGNGVVSGQSWRSLHNVTSTTTM